MVDKSGSAHIVLNQRGSTTIDHRPYTSVTTHALRWQYSCNIELVVVDAGHALNINDEYKKYHELVQLLQRDLSWGVDPFRPKRVPILIFINLLHSMCWRCQGQR